MVTALTISLRQTRASSALYKQVADDLKLAVDQCWWKPISDWQTMRDPSGVDGGRGISSVCESVNEILRNSGATIRYSNWTTPNYNASRDVITLSERRCYEREYGYMRQCLHELAHWTAGGGRLQREVPHTDAGYCIEEAIAELAANFALAHLGADIAAERLRIGTALAKVIEASGKLGAWTGIVRSAKAASECMLQFHAATVEQRIREWNSETRTPAAPRFAMSAYQSAAGTSPEFSSCSIASSIPASCLSQTRSTSLW